MNLQVEYNGKPVLRLNRILVERQKLTDEDIEKIKQLHIERLSIEGQMETARTEDLKMLFEWWTKNQFQLQDAWKFKRDQNFHRFWELKRCSCPKYDNEDAWPHGYYVYSDSCLIHGC